MMTMISLMVACVIGAAQMNGGMTCAIVMKLAVVVALMNLLIAGGAMTAIVMATAITVVVVVASV